MLVSTVFALFLLFLILIDFVVSFIFTRLCAGFFCLYVLEHPYFMVDDSFYVTPPHNLMLMIVAVIDIDAAREEFAPNFNCSGNTIYFEIANFL